MWKEKIIRFISLFVAPMALLLSIADNVLAPIVVYKICMSQIEESDIELNNINALQNVNISTMKKIETDLYSVYIPNDLLYDNESGFYKSNDNKKIIALDYEGVIRESTYLYDEGTDEYLFEKEMMDSIGYNIMDTIIAVSNFDPDNVDLLDKKEMRKNLFLGTQTSLYKNLICYYYENDDIRVLLMSTKHVKGIAFNTQIIDKMSKREYSFMFCGYSYQETCDIISTIEFK